MATRNVQCERNEINFVFLSSPLAMNPTSSSSFASVSRTVMINRTMTNIVLREEGTLLLMNKRRTVGRAAVAVALLECARRELSARVDERRGYP